MVKSVSRDQREEEDDSDEQDVGRRICRRRAACRGSRDSQHQAQAGEEWHYDETEDEARACLKLLSGRRHRVLTGVALAIPGKGVANGWSRR